MSATAAITLYPGRERPVHQRHPWVFSGAIANVRGRPANGDVVDVYDTHQTWLARGTWSSASQIRVRLFTWNEAEHLTGDLLHQRLTQALAGRAALPLLQDNPMTACRLVYAESDNLPGLIVDRYGEYLVVQLLTQGMAVRARQVVDVLAEVARPRGIYERSDAEVRQKEGLPAAVGLLWGEEPDQRILFQTHQAHFTMSWSDGQKTGFYLDQSENRQRVAAYCHDQTVLDCFCYSGGFTIYAAQAGARHITAVDTSAMMLEVLQMHLALNKLDTPVEPVEADVFKLLRQYRQEGRVFDVVILDPPKFAHNQQQIERATRGYKDINMNAMHLIPPGGILVTYSCSGLISPDLFQKVLFGAALDAGRAVQILERLSQAPDHPVRLSFPESEYLKGFICRVW
ncbi:MAG: methyltransferase domain-containing protein [Chloroflexaceae bacterium]|nr:methyltransferase domain-containing protein [Chloroflexaceae bacterium]NJO06545.1 methyltransferase domain-containing protein [Chloroflexaceae bacterium]